MRIIQLVSNLSYGDAIGNEVRSFDAVLRERGYESSIMAIDAHPALRDMVRPVSFADVKPDDTVLFHKAAGDALSKPFGALDCNKILLYHNITPAPFFLAYDPIVTYNLARGRRQLRRLAHRVNWAWGDSSYNCDELRRMGYPADRLRRLPILSTVDTHKCAPDADTVRELSAQPGARILFVGRVAPNKRQEDIIKLFAYYQARVDPQAQLYLVGSYSGYEKYYAKLCGFVADLGLQSVHITGSISDEQKAAYYQCADLFVCMSEHEGFCVPLLEAMRAGVPVAAYRCCAIGETLGDNGLSFDHKDYAAMCERLKRLKEDAAFRNEVLARQRAQLELFEPERVESEFLSLLHAATERRR